MPSNDELMDLLLGILQQIQNQENPPMFPISYEDDPIAEAKMQVKGGGRMQYRTAGPEWKDAFEKPDGWLTISTIQEKDGVAQPESNRIREVRMKPNSGGTVALYEVRRI